MMSNAKALKNISYRCPVCGTITVYEEWTTKDPDFVDELECRSHSVPEPAPKPARPHALPAPKKAKTARR